MWHPKGIVRKLMEDYSRERHAKGGYEFVYTPNIANGKLFEASGHLALQGRMYPPMESGQRRVLPEAQPAQATT